MENKQLKRKEHIDKFLQDKPNYNGRAHFIQLLQEQDDYFKYYFKSLFRSGNRHTRNLLTFLKNNPGEAFIINYIIEKLNEKIFLKGRNIEKHKK